MRAFLEGRAAKVQRVVSAPELLWEPPADVRETTQIGRFLTWLERERGLALRELRRAAPLVGRRPRRVLVGGLGDFGVRSHAPYERGARPARDAGRGVVPGRDAQLRRARRRRAPTTTRWRVLRLLADPRPRRADLGRAARPGRPGPRRAAAARRRPGRPGGRPTCRTSPRRWSPSSPPRAWARCGRAARRSSARAAWSTGSARSSRRSCSRSPATATAARTSTAASRWPRSAPGSRPSSTSCTCPYGENTLPDSTPWGDLLARAGRARVRPGPVRPPAVRAVLLRHHRQAEGDRAQPRRDPAGAPEEPRAELGPRAGRPDPVVLHHRLDDVERAGVVAAGARVDRDDRRQPAAPGHPLAVAAGRRDRRDADGREPRLPHGLPQGGRASRRRSSTCRGCGRSARRAARCRRRATGGWPSSSGRACCSTWAAAARTSAPGSCRAARCSRCGRGRSPARAWGSTRRRSTPTASRSSATWASW